MGCWSSHNDGFGRKGWLGNLALVAFALALPLAGAAQSCPNSIGRWPYGSTRSVASTGSFLYIGTGTALRIASISNPASPSLLGEAVLEEPIWGIAISGSYAYLADYNSGLVVLDVSNPGAPWKCGELDLPGPALDVAVTGNYAYLVSWPGGLSVVDITDPTNPVLAGTLAGVGSTGIEIVGTTAYVTDIGYGLRTIDITDPSHPIALGTCLTSEPLDVSVQGTYAYVADGLTGVAIISIQNPNAPISVGSFQTLGYVESLNVSGNHLYVAQDTILQIVNIENPANPQEAARMIFEGYSHDQILLGDYIYSAADYGGLLIFNVAAPTTPMQAGCLPSPGFLTQAAVQDEKAYLIDQQSGLYVLDISNPLQPAQIGQCIIHYFPYALAVQGNHAFVADSNRTLHVLDIADPSVPSEIGACALPHNPEQIAVAGHYAFVAVHSGLSVVDVSNPTAPIVAGFWASASTGVGVAVKGGFAFLATLTSGIIILDVSDPQNPFLVSSLIPFSEGLIGLSLMDDYLVASHENGFAIVDVSDPQVPALIGVHLTPYRVMESTSAGSYVVLSHWETGAHIVDLSTKSTPVEVGSFTPSRELHGMSVAGFHLYLSEGGCGFEIMDLSTCCSQPPGAFGLLAPVDSASLGACAIALDWTDSSQAISYDIYMDGTNPPVTLVAEDVPFSSIQVTVAPGNTYYWRVVAKNGCGSTTSAVWNFYSTIPGSMSLLFPVDGATYQPSPLLLDWSDSTKADAYELYFGTTIPPPLYQVGIAASQLEVSGLSGNTTYSWYVKAINTCGTTTTRKAVFTTSPPNLLLDRTLLDDGCPYGGFGHGNGLAEPGETIQIWAMVSNMGSGVSTNAVGTLTSSSPEVTIQTGAVDFPIILPGEESTSTTPFVVQLAGAVDCMTLIPFTLTLSGNGLVWTEYFYLEVGKHNHDIVFEQFESWPPDQWQVFNNGGMCVWESTATTGLPNHTGGAGSAAVADSDWCGGGATMDTELWTPAFSLPYASSATLCQPYGSTPPLYATVATLKFRAAYRDVYGSAATVALRAPGDDGDAFAVDISSNGGTSWTNLLFWDEDHSPFGPGVQAALDLTPFAGISNLLLRFVYYAADWYWWAEVDDVQVTLPYACTKCGPPPSDFTYLVPADSAVDVDPSVLLNWDDSPGAECYTLYFGTADPPPQFDTNLPASQRPVSGLQPFTWYYWRVEAINAFGISSASSGTWRFRTAGMGGAPKEVPDGSLKAVKAGSQITLSWGPTCGQADNYTIYAGDLDALTGFGNYSHASIRCNDAAGDYRETFTPSVGNAYYLVVPRTADGVEGSYGGTIPQGTNPAGCDITDWMPEACPGAAIGSGTYHGYYQQINNGGWEGYINSAATFTVQNGALTAIGDDAESIVYISPANYVLMLGYSHILDAPIALGEGQPFEVTYFLQYDDGISNVLESTYHFSGAYEADHLYGAMDMAVTALDPVYSDFAGHWYFTFDIGLVEQPPSGALIMGAATQTNNADWEGYLNNPFILQIDGTALTGIQTPRYNPMVYVTPTNYVLQLDFTATAPADFSPVALSPGAPFMMQKTQTYDDGTQDVLSTVWTVSGTVQSPEYIIGTVDAVVTALQVDYKEYVGHWTWSFTNGIQSPGKRRASSTSNARFTVAAPRWVEGPPPVFLHRTTGSSAK